MRKISKEAIDLIVRNEVSSKDTYDSSYTGVIWPGAQSGATIGIGYDLGYVTREEFIKDWRGMVSQEALFILGPMVGVKGAEAKKFVTKSIKVPYDAAYKVFEKKTLPKWIAQVEKALPNTDKLSDDSMGALVSLAYNRGASFSSRGGRYTEMRNIKILMQEENFKGIPDEFRSMKRLWEDQNLDGLLRRRDEEAALFEKGLKKPVTKPKPIGPITGAFAALAAAIYAAWEWVSTHPWELCIGTAATLGFIGFIYYRIKQRKNNVKTV
jgi:GH24 family phage-related lysozyme (muramidase)